MDDDFEDIDVFNLVDSPPVVFLGITGGEIAGVLMVSLVVSIVVWGLVAIIMGNFIILAVGLPLTIFCGLFGLAKLIEKRKRGKHEDYFADYLKVVMSRRLGLKLVETFNGRWGLGR